MEEDLITLSKKEAEMVQHHHEQLRRICTRISLLRVYFEVNLTNLSDMTSLAAFSSLQTDP